MSSTTLSKKEWIELDQTIFRAARDVMRVMALTGQRVREYLDQHTHRKVCKLTQAEQRYHRRIR